MSKSIGHPITEKVRQCNDCGLEQEKGRKPSKATHGNAFNGALDVGVPIDRYQSDNDGLQDLCLGCLSERRVEGERVTRFATFDEH